MMSSTVGSRALREFRKCLAVGAAPSNFRLLATSSANNDTAAYLAKYSKLNILLRKSDEKAKKTVKKKKNLAEKDATKRLTFQDTQKMTTFNCGLKIHLIDVLCSDSYNGELNEKGFQITKVKVDPKFTRVHVFYQAPLANNDELDEIKNTLKIHAPNIRHEVETVALMGRIPKMEFVPDPGSPNSIPTVEEVQRILRVQKERVNLGKTEAEIDEEDDDRLQFELDRIRGMKLKPDVLKFNRDEALNKVITEMALMSPPQRMIEK